MVLQPRTNPPEIILTCSFGVFYNRRTSSVPSSFLPLSRIRIAITFSFSLPPKLHYTTLFSFFSSAKITFFIFLFRQNYTAQNHITSRGTVRNPLMFPFSKLGLMFIAHIGSRCHEDHIHFIFYYLQEKKRGLDSVGRKDLRHILNSDNFRFFLYFTIFRFCLT